MLLTATSLACDTNTFKLRENVTKLHCFKQLLHSVNNNVAYSSLSAHTRRTSYKIPFAIRQSLRPALLQIASYAVFPPVYNFLPYQTHFCRDDKAQMTTCNYKTNKVHSQLPLQIHFTSQNMSDIIPEKSLKGISKPLHTGVQNADKYSTHTHPLPF